MNKCSWATRVSGGAHGFIGRHASHQYHLWFHSSALPVNDSVGLVGLWGKNTENLNKSLFVFPIELFVGRYQAGHFSHTRAVIFFLLKDKDESRFSRLTEKKKFARENRHDLRVSRSVGATGFLIKTPDILRLERSISCYWVQRYSIPKQIRLTDIWYLKVEFIINFSYCLKMSWCLKCIFKSTEQNTAVLEKRQMLRTP